MTNKTQEDKIAGLVRRFSIGGDSNEKYVIGPNQGFVIIVSPVPEFYEFYELKPGEEYKTPSSALITGKPGFENELEKLESIFRFEERQPMIYDGDRLEDLCDVEVAPLMRERLKDIYALGLRANLRGIIKEGFETDVDRTTQTFNGLADKEIRDLIKKSNYAEALFRRPTDVTIGQKVYRGVNLDRLAEIEGKEFVGDTLDWTIRGCLENRHSFSERLLELLADNPQHMKLVNPILREFAIPYLAERDLSMVGDGWDKKTQMQSYADGAKVFRKLELSVDEIQAKIKQCGGDRQYLSNQFREVLEKNKMTT
ncbi:MAG: hypothetical protein WCI72_03475 [archaeon]